MTTTLAHRAGVLAPVLVAVVSHAACQPRSGGITTTPTGVVVITLDTTRADRLPAYGLMGVSMPHLDRLAQEGIVFDRASSVGPLTLPAHCSLFTGLFPPGHGVRDNSGPSLAPEHTTLAEILRARGFATAAFVGSMVLDANRGLAQGFDVYGGVAGTGAPADHRDEMAGQRRADAVVTDAIRWLDGSRGSRFFLWVHLYDAHRPYDPPEPFRSRYTDPYIGEIAFADSQIGRLLETLDRRHLLDRTIFVVAGDHGESLGEHGERDHGIFIYESVLRVPLIVRAPAYAPRRVDSAVRLVDVMPTILDMLDLPQPTGNGVSLTELMNGRRRHLDVDVYAESLYPQRFGWSPLRAVRSGRFKLIDAPRPEVYDLDRDPFEERNIHHERRALAKALAARVNVLATGSRQPAIQNSPAPILREVEARLAALGYVGSSAGGEPQRDAPLPDPKDCLHTLWQEQDSFAQPGFSARCRPGR
jgi:arylsulfatase A-like enzyme